MSWRGDDLDPEGWGPNEADEEMAELQARARRDRKRTDAMKAGAFHPDALPSVPMFPDVPAPGPIARPAPNLDSLPRDTGDAPTMKALAVLAALALASSAHAQSDTLTYTGSCEFTASTLPNVQQVRFVAQGNALHFEARFAPGVYDPVEYWIGTPRETDFCWKFTADLVDLDDPNGEQSYYVLASYGADQLMLWKGTTSQRLGPPLAIVSMHLASDGMSFDLAASAFGTARRFRFDIRFIAHEYDQPRPCSPYSYSGEITLLDPTPALRASWGSLKVRWR